MGRLHLFFNELMDNYGPLVRIKLLKWTVLVEDVEDIEIVMRTEGPHPRRDGHLIHDLSCEEKNISKGLMSLQGEEWKQFRSPLSARIMRTKCSHQYLPAQNEVASDLVMRLREDTLKPKEMFEMLFRYSCECVSLLTFNKRLGYLKSDVGSEKLQILKDIRTMFRIMNECLYIHPFVLKNFPLQVKKDYSESFDRITGFARINYTDAIQCIHSQQPDVQNSREEHNFLTGLITKDSVSMNNLLTVAIDFMAGGTDSTARALQMNLYALARHPEKQEKLRKEILKEIGPSGPVTVSALGRMKYLQACVRESMRLYHPLLCGTQRYLPTDVVLQGYKIPAGTPIVLMSQRAVKNEKHFPEPETYRPERWLRNKTGNRPTHIPPLAPLPFGFGPRQCLGKRFAENEIYIATAKILQNFDVQLEPNHEEIDIIYELFVGTKDHIRFVYKDRK